MDNAFSSNFNIILVEWYRLNKRNLPWRETSNPYLIWISEIILQQTRVIQGYDYYVRFIENFPNVNSLAQAEEIEVLKLWQGLGYYSRARNLHAAAKMIVEKFDGIFPLNYNDVLSLKGIGEYTAAAITSFAYNLPYAVVDGNVYRFLSRYFGIDTPIDSTKGKKEFSILAKDLLDSRNPAIHNQAIMEFGALQCVPVSPKCLECCYANQCFAYNANQVNKYPQKQMKTKTKDRFLNYFDVDFGIHTFLNKRSDNDIWKGLYEFPLIETSCSVGFPELEKNEDFKSMFKGVGQISITKISRTIKQVLSHQNIYATFHKIKITQNTEFEKKFIQIEKNKLDNYPVSRLIERYLLSCSDNIK